MKESDLIESEVEKFEERGFFIQSNERRGNK